MKGITEKAGVGVVPWVRGVALGRSFSSGILIETACGAGDEE